MVFFAVGFETTAPANALAIHRAKTRGHRQFLRCSSPMCWCRRPCERSFRRPTTASRASSRPAMSAPSWAQRPMSRSPASYRVPIVVTGFEPLDILRGHPDVRRPARGRARRGSRTSTVASVRSAGNLSAQDLIREVFHIVPRKWRGIGEIAESGFGLRGRLRRLRRGTALRSRWQGCRTAGPLHQRPRSSGGEEAVRMSGLREGLHARASAWRDHGFGRRRLRRLLPLPERGGRKKRGRMNDKPVFAPVCPLPATVEGRVELAHGGGGRAMARLIESLILPAFDNPALRRRHDGAAIDTGGPCAFTTELLRRAAALLSRRGYRQPGGQRHGQRSCHVRGAAALAQRRLHPGGRPAPRGSRAGRRIHGPGGGLGRGGDRHRRPQGRGAGQGRRPLHQHVGRRPPPAWRRSPSARRPAGRCDHLERRYRPPWNRGHGGAGEPRLRIPARERLRARGRGRRWRCSTPA